MREKELKIKIEEQMDFECLPSCLKAVFDYYNINISQDKIINCVSKNSFKLYDWEFKAGKLAVEQGLSVEIFTNVNYIFDPSWFKLEEGEILKKLKQEFNFSKNRQTEISKQPDQKVFIYPNKDIASRYTNEIKAVINYIQVGGRINFSPVSKKLIEDKLSENIPLIVSINSVLLHRMKRVFNNKPDDIRGVTWGHVVVISGYDKKRFKLSDPGGLFYRDSLEYWVDKDLLLESFLRYNGQLLVLKKKT